MPIIVLYSRMFPPPPLCVCCFSVTGFLPGSRQGRSRSKERTFVSLFFYPPAGIVVVVFMRLFNLEIMTPFFHFLFFLFFERERGSEATDRHRSNSLVLFWRLLISGQGLSHSGRILCTISYIIMKELATGITISWRTDSHWEDNIMWRYIGGSSNIPYH